MCLTICFSIAMNTAKEPENQNVHFSLRSANHLENKTEFKFSMRVGKMSNLFWLILHYIFFSVCQGKTGGGLEQLLHVCSLKKAVFWGECQKKTKQNKTKQNKQRTGVLFSLPTCIVVFP